MGLEGGCEGKVSQVNAKNGSAPKLMVLQVRYMVLEVILVLVLLTKIYSILLQDRVILIQPTHLL